VWVGLDAEWRPSGKYDAYLPAPAPATLQEIGPYALKPKGTTGTLQNLLPLCGDHPSRISWPVSILQLALGPGLVLVVDLLALHQAEELSAVSASVAPVDEAHSTPIKSLLDASVGVLLRAPWAAVLACGIDGDLSRLAGSYPGWRDVFSSVEGAVDLPVLAGAAEVMPQREGASGALQGGGRGEARDTIAASCASFRREGLSGIAQRYLGLPLLKRQQTSDWQRRPLTPPQLRYAASDALCLVALAGAMQGVRQNLENASRAGSTPRLVATGEDGERTRHGLERSGVTVTPCFMGCLGTASPSAREIERSAASFGPLEGEDAHAQSVGMSSPGAHAQSVGVSSLSVEGTASGSDTLSRSDTLAIGGAE